MSVFDRVLTDDVEVRAYLATIIGVTRGPFGQRNQATLVVGASTEIARNTTRDRVLHVTVTRSNIAQNVAAATVTFSQADQVSTNDFERVFGAADVFRFVLKPSESLSMLLTGSAGSVPFSFGIDTF
jgi:hypothetical protein